MSGACTFVTTIDRSCSGSANVLRRVFFRSGRVMSVLNRGCVVGYPRLSVVGGAVLSLIILAPLLLLLPLVVPTIGGSMSVVAANVACARKSSFGSAALVCLEPCTVESPSQSGLGFLGDPLVGDNVRPFPLPLPLYGWSSRACDADNLWFTQC